MTIARVEDIDFVVFIIKMESLILMPSCSLSIGSIAKNPARKLPKCHPESRIQYLSYFGLCRRSLYRWKAQLTINKGKCGIEKLRQTMMTRQGTTYRIRSWRWIFDNIVVLTTRKIGYGAKHSSIMQKWFQNVFF